MMSICIAEMGDKTQLLVASFAAKFKIHDIIIGVITATIVLNLLGVLLGGAISKIIPMEYVNLAAGFFFLIFALLTISQNQVEDETEKFRLRRGSCIGIGTAFFLAELGDKTQLSAIAFAAKDPDQILPVFIGATLGMMIADGLGLIAGHLMGKRLPERLMQIIAYGIFTVFGFITLWQCINIFVPGRGMAPFIIISVTYAILTLLLIKMSKQSVNAI